METGNNLLYCYNKGCGQRFDPACNSADLCVYHPGVPVFHDAYKSWSCCEKKTTDFTEFLGIRGCTTSHHNGEKPSPLKTSTENCSPSAVHVEEPKRLPQRPQKTVRPDRNAPTVNLPVTIASALKTQLEQMQNKVKREKQKDADCAVPIGTSCKNGGCRKTFECEADNSEECQFHPGQPIFHEGLKFWSCCVRRTSDFNSFLEQSGCTSGRHLWIKSKEQEKERPSCRYDWYQTGSHVFVSVYAKLPVPSLCRVEANAVVLTVHLIFGEEKSTFQLDLELFGLVDVQRSEVTYSPNKVEMKLKKAEARTWTTLVLPNGQS